MNKLDELVDARVSPESLVNQILKRDLHAYIKARFGPLMFALAKGWPVDKAAFKEVLARAKEE